MKTSSVIFLVSFIMIFILGGGLFLYDLNVDNREVKLRNKYDAQMKVCESNFDKMWKIIKQTAQVSDEYQKSFKEIYKPLMEGRYSSKDGQQVLMKWIQEDNPKFDTKLFSELNVVIEANRNSFHREQTKLTAIWEQHNNLLKVKPDMWFINDGIEFISHKIISSSKTKEIFELGEENDIDLF